MVRPAGLALRAGDLADGLAGLGLFLPRSLSDNSQNPVAAPITCSRTISWCFLWQHEMLQLPMSDRLLGSALGRVKSPRSLKFNGRDLTLRPAGSKN